MSFKGNYKSILEIVRNEIESGKQVFGTIMPTETDLANRYNVSRPTIAKVYNTLQEEGYVIKKPGTGTTVTHKSRKQKFTFGLLLPGAGESEIFSIISERFLSHSQSGKFDCLWEGTTTSDATMRRELIEKCANDYITQKVNGVFFAPLERVNDAEELNLKICEKLRNAGIPIVLIDRDIVEFPLRSGFDLVGLDNFNAGYSMGEHLIKMGCEHIHFFYRPDSAYSVRLRLYGVAAALRHYNLNFGKDNDICGNPEDLDFVQNISYTRGKTGIVCANDSTAAVLMSSLDAVDVKIASDVLVCGYDDMKYAKHLKYTLTSYRQPCEEITDTAIDLMIRRINNIDSAPLLANITGKIIVRESSRFKS
ncbi:MAG: LacI family DNA-binding transcriptional regulator [Dysgonomonas sp.]